MSKADRGESEMLPEPQRAERSLPGTDAHRQPGAVILGGTHGSLSVARSLGRRGVPVWLLETGPSVASFSRHVAKRVRWKGPEANRAVEWLLDLAIRHHLQHWVLFPAADQETQFIAENHDRLSGQFRLITLPWAVLQEAQDKNRLYMKAAELGLAYPQSYLPDGTSGIPNPARFPVIIKPNMRVDHTSLGADKAWQADNRESFDALYRQARRQLPADEIVVQEMIPGGGDSQFSYTGLWNRGRPAASAVMRRSRQFSLRFGTGTFVETVHNPEVEGIAERLLQSLGYHGLVEAEFKHDARDGRYKVLDVNTRIWTWIGLGEAAGVDFAWLAWRLAAGEEVGRVRGRAGVSWRYLPRDILACIQETKAGRMSKRGFMASLLRRSAPASFAWNDPLPGLVDLPLALFRILRRAV